MADVVKGGMLSVGAFVLLFGAAVVGTNAIGVSLTPADERTVLIILAIAALFIGFNA